MKIQSSSKLVYESINQSVLDSVPKNVKSVLDIGCGSGAFGSAQKYSRNFLVTGITYNTVEADIAKTLLDRVEIANLNDINAHLLGRYDCIVCSHVLEHLNKPEVLLSLLAKHCLLPRGVLIVALPNPLYWKQRLQFMRGHFRYTDGGLMDRTHYRFYDWHTAQELLMHAGFSIQSSQAQGSIPLSRFFGSLSKYIDRNFVNYMPSLFGVQFIFSCIID